MSSKERSMLLRVILISLLMDIMACVVVVIVMSCHGNWQKLSQAWNQFDKYANTLGILSFLFVVTYLSVNTYRYCSFCFCTMQTRL